MYFIRFKNPKNSGIQATNGARGFLIRKYTHFILCQLLLSVKSGASGLQEVTAALSHGHVEVIP